MYGPLMPVNDPDNDSHSASYVPTSTPTSYQTIPLLSCSLPLTSNTTHQITPPMGESGLCTQRERPRISGQRTDAVPSTFSLPPTQLTLS